MQSIMLERYDPLVIFHGTDEQIEAVEAAQDRNDNLIITLADKIRAGAVDYAYYDSVSTGCDGRAWCLRYVLHRSAKYGENLQVTSLTYIDGIFQYANSDVEVTDNAKLTREFSTLKSPIYFE